MGTQRSSMSGTSLGMDPQNSPFKTFVKFRRGAPGDSQSRAGTRATPPDNHLSFAVTPDGVLPSIPVVEWDGETYADL